MIPAEKTAIQLNQELYESIGTDAIWQLLKQANQNIRTHAHHMLDMADTMFDHVISRYRLIQFPKKFQLARLTVFDNDTQHSVLSALDAGMGAYIYGKRGRGKTDLAAAVARELIARIGRKRIAEGWEHRAKNGWSGEPNRPEVDRYVSIAFSVATAYNTENIVFKNTALLMDDIKRCFDENAPQSKQDLIEHYSCAPVLILDDMGMEKPSAFVRETFDVIVNQRWSEERLTIFTSNFDLMRLEAHYEDEGRISSRVAGMCDVIELTGDDRRPRRA